jgi:pimeloyl-ACP methyl ester carboxylesterase
MLVFERSVAHGLRAATAFIGLVLVHPVLGQGTGGELQHAPVPGGQIEYLDRGRGEPVLLIHGAMVADLLAPLAAEPALASYRIILLHRRGYAGSSPTGDTWSISQDAADAAALLTYLGLFRAHIIGHSVGGIVALECAATYPQQVQTLTLLDPPLTFMKAQHLEPRTGGADAVETFLLEKGRPDFRERLNERIPGAIEQARKDERRFNVTEWQALGAWTFDEAKAGHVSAPLLYMSQQHAEGVDTARRWWPRMEFIELKGETHMFPFEAPSLTAGAVARFLSRHRM